MIRGKEDIDTGSLHVALGNKRYMFMLSILFCGYIGDSLFI